MEIKKFEFLDEISFTGADDFKKLKESVEKIGIQQPIILLKRENSFYIVDGYKRVKIYKIKDFPYSIIEKSFTNEEILLEYCKKNAFRDFNDIEISNILKVINKYFNNSLELIKKVFNCLEIKYSDKIVEKYLTLQNLTLDAKIRYINNTLNKNIGLKLSKINEKAQNYILKLFDNLKLNNNKQKRVFEMLFDLSKRKDLSIDKLIEEFFSKFINEPYTKKLEIDFFDKLISIHSPNFYKFNLKFNDFKKSFIGKGLSKVNCYSPSLFEDENFKIEIFFSNLDELLKKLKLIEKNIECLLKEQEYNELFN